MTRSPVANSRRQRCEDVTPDVFVRRTRAGHSVELNQATLPRLLVNRRYYQELKSGPQDKASRAWLSECLQSANWLVKALDQRARTIVKVVSRNRQAPAGLLRTRRVGDEADDAARGRRSDRNARIDRQPGHLEQISAVRPRAVRAQIFLRLGRRRRRTAARAAPRRKRSRPAIRRADRRRGPKSSATTPSPGCSRSKGFDVARRTVVKYREAMGIGSSIQRRRMRKIGG